MKRTKTFTLSGGETVVLRAMSGAQRDRFMQTELDPKMPCKSLYCELLVRTIANEDGSLKYGESETDVAAEDLPGTVIDELFPLAMEFNGIGTKAVDEAKKAYPASVDSGSSLPAT